MDNAIHPLNNWGLVLHGSLITSSGITRLRCDVSLTSSYVQTGATELCLTNENSHLNGRRTLALSVGHTMFMQLAPGEAD